MQTIIAYALTFAASLLLIVVLVYWTWAWFAPRAEPRVPAVAEAGGQVAAADSLFGAAQQDSVQLDDTPLMGATLKLLGVVAGSAGRAGYALVRLDAKTTLAVRAGEDVAPGVKLAEVHADRVVLEHGGTSKIRETLTWPKKNSVAEFPGTQIIN